MVFSWYVLYLLRLPTDISRVSQQTDKLLQPEHSSSINLPEYSQPMTTALQIGLVNLLRSFNVLPSMVVGHSSGEIAAA